MTMEELLRENELLKSRLEEATETLEAIRTGQVDALVVQDGDIHELYTLRSADLAYRIFLEHMAEGAVSLNYDGLIVFSNSQFAQIVSAPLAKVVGSNFLDFVSKEDAEEFNKVFNNKNGKADIALVADARLVYVRVSLNASQVEGDELINMIVTDLTQQKQSEIELTNKNQELKRLNEALTSSNNDLQQFASVASHDLQEPLRKIQIFSKFLKDESYTILSDTSRQHIDKVITCAQRMKVLIVDILTYSRLSADDQNLAPTNLNDVLEEILDDFDLKIGEKNARIELGELGIVEGNQGQLRQVFYNLVSNALKFVSSDRQPFISIQRKPLNAAELGLSLEDGQLYCRISVTDNGIGFDEAYSTLIFGLFEKLNPKTSYEGSGIGLAIAKKIIDKHHGLIIATSKLNVGTEFNVILPFKQPESN